MTVHSMQEVARMAINQGLSDDAAATAVAIAKAESGLDDEAIGDVNLETAKWGPSYGLWQIRTLKAAPTGDTRNLAHLMGGSVNQAAGMALISNGGRNWGPWTTYTSGAYLAFLLQAKQAVITAKNLGATDGTALDAGEAVEEIIPGDKGKTATALGSLTDVAGSLGKISAALGALADPSSDTFKRGVKITVGGTLLLTGLIVLNKDILGSTVGKVAAVTPVGRGAKLAAVGVEAATAVAK